MAEADPLWPAGTKPSNPHDSAHLHVAGLARYVDDEPEAAGTLHLVVHGTHALALWGARLATANIVMLFLGQRIAKDYAGAASLVPYFVLCAGALLVLGMPVA